MIIDCIKSCDKRLPESRKAIEETKKRCKKEEMMKAHFKEFTREEFDKNFLHGLGPVLQGVDYYECAEKCKIPKEMSGRASKTGNELIEMYYERCLMATKNFDHFENRFKVDILAEMKCHVMKKEINLKFLGKMEKELVEKQPLILDLSK